MIIIFFLLTVPFLLFIIIFYSLYKRHKNYVERENKTEKLLDNLITLTDEKINGETDETKKPL